MSGQGAGLGIKAFRSYVRRAALRRVDNKPVVPIARWFVVRGDTVMVRTGRDRGKTGKVTEVLRKKNRIVVAGVNVRRRVFKSATGGPPTLKALESPIAYSNVNLVDPATSKRTKVSIRFTDAGLRTRVASASGTVIPWPEEMKLNRSLKPATPGPKDTDAVEVARVTYAPPAALLPYLQRGTGQLWTTKTRGPAGEATAASSARPAVVNDVRLRKVNRNRILGWWERQREAYAVANRVSDILGADAVLQAALSAAGGGRRGRKGGSAAAPPAADAQGSRQAAEMR